MEIKLQFLETIPSINNMKNSLNDIVSILILYDSHKIIVPNFEKNINKKEITSLIIQNFKKTIPINIFIFLNSNLFGVCEFIPFNDSKWIDIKKTNNNINNINENKIINLKIYIKSIMIKNVKNNNKKSNSLLTSKNKKENITSSSNNIKEQFFSSNYLNFISPYHSNQNFRNKSHSRDYEVNLTELTPQSTNNTNLFKEKNIFKSQSPISSSLHYKKIAPKAYRKKYSNLRMKRPSLNYIKDDRKNNKNNSQKSIKIEKIQNYQNYFEGRNNQKNISLKLENHKLEDEIIDNNFKNTIKNDDIIFDYNNNLKNKQNIDSFYLIPNEDNFISDDSKSDKNNEKENSSIQIFNSAKTDFLIFYTNDYLSSITTDTLSLEVQLMIEKIFDLQNTFHQQFNILNDKYNKYKKYYELYSEQYFLILKKYNRLKEKDKKSEINKMKFSIKNPKTKKEDMIELFKKEIQVWKKMITQKTNLKNTMEKSLFKIFISIITSNKNKLSILQKKFLANLLEKKKELNNSVNFSYKKIIHIKNTFSGDFYNTSKIKPVKFDSIYSPISNRHNIKKKIDDKNKNFKPKKKVNQSKK